MYQKKQSAELWEKKTKETKQIINKRKYCSCQKQIIIKPKKASAVSLFLFSDILQNKIVIK